MKRVLAGLSVLVIALVAVLTAGTFSNRSRQVSAPPAAPLKIDRTAALARFSRAVQFQTISYEESGKPTEQQAFVDWLQHAYPRAHAAMTREVVGGGSLLYTWPGSDGALAPVLFMAHYDVVPVEPGTESRWTHPPFSGAVADGYVWGRGTLDDKMSVIGLFEAAEALSGEGFRPERTVMFAIDHDEEIGGEQGAAAIARLLRTRGVKLDAVVDEGGSVMADGVSFVHRPVALVGIAEKGAASIELLASGSGGHSAMPPERTAVGSIAAAVDRIQMRPFPASVSGATAETLRWLAPEARPLERIALSNLWLFEPFLKMQARRSNALNATVRTTIAPTIIGGGVKSNVIPSRARAVLNFRILPGETIATVVAHVRDAIDDPHVEVRVLSESRREPSPLSDATSPQFGILQKTIAQLFPAAVVSPYLVIGGTDARYFRELTPNVYRFSPVALDERNLHRAHGTDERLGVEAYFTAIRFYRALISNMASHPPDGRRHGV